MKTIEQTAAIPTLALFSAILYETPVSRRNHLNHLVTLDRATARIDPDDLNWVVSTQSQLNSLLGSKSFQERYAAFKHISGLDDSIFWDIPSETAPPANTANNIIVSPYKVLSMITRETALYRKWEVDEMLTDSRWLKQKPKNISVFPYLKITETSESWLRNLQEAAPFYLRFRIFDKWMARVIQNDEKNKRNTKRRNRDRKTHAIL